MAQLGYRWVSLRSTHPTFVLLDWSAAQLDSAFDEIAAPAGAARV